MPLAITPTFSPWAHTSDDSYIYQLSLVSATATVSFLAPYARTTRHEEAFFPLENQGQKRLASLARLMIRDIMRVSCTLLWVRLKLSNFASEGLNMDSFKLIGGAMVGEDAGFGPSSISLISYASCRDSRWACSPCERV